MAVDTQTQYRRLSWLMGLVAFVIGLKYWGLAVRDPDLGWHLLGGAWILANKALPSDDFINSFNDSWHDYHWLGQILLYKLYEIGGYDLLRVFIGLVMACLFKLLFDICVISGGKRQSPIIIAFFLITSTVLISPLITIRPQIIAICLIALCVRRLIQKPNTREWALLLSIAILLANVHVYWIFVPFLWGVYRVIPSLIRKRQHLRYSVGILAVLCLAGLASPYHIQNYALVYEYMRIPEFLLRTISEFRGALTIDGIQPWILLLYMVITVRTFRLRRALVRSGDTVAMLISLILAIRNAKFIALLTVLSLPYLVWNISTAAKKYIPGIFRKDSVPIRLAVYVVLISFLIVCVRGFPLFNDRSDVTKARYPQAACTEIAKQVITPVNDRDHIRILTHFNHGGWCRWFIYQENPDTDYRVVTDGRTQGVPVEHFENSYNLYRMKEHWQEILKEWTPDVALTHKGEALSEGLVLHHDWRMIFEDDHFRVFVPRAGTPVAQKLRSSL